MSSNITPLHSPHQKQGRFDNLQEYTFRELMGRDFKPREYILEPWLRNGESCLLYASTGIGKSLLANTIALAVAGGGSIAGWKAPKPRRVYLCDAEMNVDDLRRRLIDLIPAIEGLDSNAAADNIILLPYTDQHPDAELPNLAETESRFPEDQSGQDELFHRIVASGAELAVLDNFSTLAEVADENAASSFSPVLKFLMRLKAAGIATILIHHAGKNGDTYRGSSKLATTFEVIISLTPSGNPDDHQGASFELSWKKFRSFRAESVKPISMRLTTLNGSLQWLIGQAEETILQKLVRAARSCSYPTQSALAAHLGIAQGTISKRRDTAIEEGLITKLEWDECLTAARETQSGNDDGDDY